MTQENSVTRRNFLKRSGGASAAAFSAPLVVSTNVFGANETVNLGFISVGRRSGGLMNDFRNTKGSQIVAVSDVNKPRMDRVVGNKNWKKYPDYRKMLEAKDVDAVVISTPDHWHALNSIHACMAGKDVYVEKPMTLTIVEGRQMVKAARKYDRVVQCGSQQRSDAKCRIGCEMVRNRRVGKIHTVHADNYHSPWDRPFPSQPVPDGLNWDMWLGPADWRDYHRDIYIPRARPGWISIVPFSGGEVTGWGAHGLDIIQWGLGLDQTGPVEIWTEGSSRDLNRVVHMKYANGIKVVTDGKGPAGGGLFEGDKGTVMVSRGVYKVNPESAGKPITESEEHLPVSKHHQQNFIDCIKSREKPIADVEFGHRAATLCHMMNIARWTHRKLQWDPNKEVFTNDKEANFYLDRERRKPWELPKI